MDFNLFGGMLGGLGGAGGRGYSSTLQGKVIATAFADPYNQMVQALKNHKAQTVKGGLGGGGCLGVDGAGAAPAPTPVQTPVAQPVKKPAPKPVATASSG